MVFKKPYAFLMKNFKIIHLILAIFSIYLIMRVNTILNFFELFIKGNVNKVYAVDYISNFYIFIVILSIIICLIVLILMKYKKKPHLLYVIFIAVYLAIGFIIGYANVGLNTIYDSILSMKDLLLYRDILKILLVIQYISFCFVFVRALGFDIKKFDFDSEIHGFKIDEADEEEVEVVINDTNKYGRKIRRRLRELRYYYFENKVYINSVLIIILLIVLSGIVIDKEVINNVFSENEIFSTENFTFSVENSYISNIGYDNKKVTNKDSSFIIVQLNVKNNNVPKKLNVGNILLCIGDKSYSSKTTYGKKFTDLGIVYNGNEIKKQSNYIFIFNVENEYIDDEMYFIYGSDRRVRLNPINLDVVTEKVSYKIGEALDFSNSFYGGGNFTIESYEFGDKFNYNYSYDVMGQVFESSIIISSVNKAILHLRTNSSYSSDLSDFLLLSRYATLKYKIGDLEYSSSFTNKAPSSYNDGVYLAVDKNMLNAEKIWFDIVLRNKRYIYNIK